MDFSSFFIPVAAVCVLFFLLGMRFSSSRMNRRISYLLDAMEDEELNFSFREDRFLTRRFNRILNRMRLLFEKKRRTISEREKYYGAMLDNVSTGVMVVDDADGHVVYSNSSALAILGISSVSNIRQLERVSPSIMEAFSRVRDGHEERADFMNEISRRVVLVRSSSARIAERDVRIIAFNDISGEIDENESVSWTKLVRVLTHEIMNTVTPIASLSEALLKYSGDTRSDIDVKEGLETILSSSRGLMKFVASYRNLTHIPAPVRKVVYLRDIVARVFKLVEEQANASGTAMVFNEKSDDIILYVDEDQISQILVNLLKNAMQAGADRIELTACIDASESVILNVANNGEPVSEESLSEIFVPFYTTKSSGTGLGLSISRQIMRLHNGTLRLTSSNPGKTVFTLVFR